MLVLTRELGEVVIIGAGTPYETQVEVVDVRGDKVKLGFTAPINVSVNRLEVQLAINGVTR